MINFLTFADTVVLIHAIDRLFFGPVDIPTALVIASCISPFSERLLDTYADLGFVSNFFPNCYCISTEQLWGCPNANLTLNVLTFTPIIRCELMIQCKAIITKLRINQKEKLFKMKVQFWLILRLRIFVWFF